MKCSLSAPTEEEAISQTMGDCGIADDGGDDAASSLDGCGTSGDDGDNNGGCDGDNGDGNATDNDWDEVGDMLCESSQPPACPENYEKKVIDSTKMLPFQECVETMKTVTVEVPATRKVAKCVKKPMEYFKKVLVKC